MLENERGNSSKMRLIGGDSRDDLSMPFLYFCQFDCSHPTKGNVCVFFSVMDSFALRVIDPFQRVLFPIFGRA